MYTNVHLIIDESHCCEAWVHLKIYLPVLISIVADIGVTYVVSNVDGSEVVTKLDIVVFNSVCEIDFRMFCLWNLSLTFSEYF